MTITSKDNEKLKLVRKLAVAKHREREGLFVTEGEDLLDAGLAAGLEPAVLLTRAGAGLGGDEVDAELLDAVSQLGSGTRAIAVWARPPLERPTLPLIGGSAGRLSSERGVCVYLHEVGDPGNVGSIVRSAAAFGAAEVTLGPGCADAYGPKAIRASMGAIFALSVGHGDFDRTPAPRLALVARGGEAEPPAAATICLGSERAGLPPEVVAACDAAWTIPVREDAVESLGVAAAAAIALSRIGSRVGE